MPGAPFMNEAVHVRAKDSRSPPYSVRPEEYKTMLEFIFKTYFSDLPFSDRFLRATSNTAGTSISLRREDNSSA